VIYFDDGKLTTNKDESLMNLKSTILLTGRPGCGKTTLIQRIIPHLPIPVNGFYTQEIRLPAAAHRKSRRLGFELITMDGQRGVLAHVDPVQIGGHTQPRIGHYIVKLHTLQTLAVPSLLKSTTEGGWAVIDEIGPMELLSEPFCQAVIELLSNEVNILASIVQRSTPFGDQIKARPDVTLIELKRHTQDAVFNHILSLVDSS
jgi:nucleoside-triphosphatase